MEKTLDDVMEKNSLEEKTSLSTQVGAPDHMVMGLFACLTGCRRASEGTDGIGET